jgi:sigma-54 dependent transcriptional regulator, acetoin dehydrogenase operon transcriptional activator AcoR
VSRRLLTPLESIERDAIVQSLLDYQGSKAKVAGGHARGTSLDSVQINRSGAAHPSRRGATSG